jgi:hypothetical protein
MSRRKCVSGYDRAYAGAPGKKISAKDFRALQIERDAFHGDWNYVIMPRTKER